MKEYYTTREVARIIGKSKQTIINWDKNGLLKPAFVSPAGHRYYTQEQLNYLLSLKKDPPKRKVIGYCRVPNSEYEDDLKKQIDRVKEYMAAKEYKFEIITDIGSGMDYNRKGFNKIMNMVINGEVDKIVILYKDRLVRFGFEFIKNICHKHGTVIEVIDDTEKLDEDEVIKDLAQIIIKFSEELYGEKSDEKIVEKAANYN